MRASTLACVAALALGLGPPAGAQVTAPAPAGPAATRAATSAPHGARPPAARPVDLNRASAAELRKLPGIGEAEARRIAEGRPYKSKADLVSKKVIDQTEYERLKRLVVVDHRKAAAPRPGPRASAALPAASKPVSRPSSRP